MTVIITLLLSDTELNRIDAVWRQNMDYKSRSDYIRHAVRSYTDHIEGLTQQA